MDYAGSLKTVRALILEANDRNTGDNQAMAEALRKVGNAQVTEKYMETDHSFSDHRIALQDTILEWLQSLATPRSGSEMQRHPPARTAQITSSTQDRVFNASSDA